MFFGLSAGHYRCTIFLQVDTPSLWLSQPYYLENSTEFINAYSELIAQVWELVYPTENGTKVAADMIQFSAELAHVRYLPSLVVTLTKNII